ncbi:hypothetical protein LTR64_000005 [Lithohypha guttulata]|uniref:uncharacterized protein n=1 Tax=Lithohypha guttulata TaxID=1690604 RepID=UPI002DE1339D|nr:hypothetical protein LTR51_007367 [Lithohypha guttulata]
MPGLVVRPCRIGINGFGRIGRMVLRASLLREDVEVVAINHTCASIEDLILLFTHDSTHGPLSRIVHEPITIEETQSGNLSINGREIALISQRNIEKIEWSALGVEYVAECTGKFRSTTLASAHVNHGGAKKVLISAPSPDAPTFVYKVNTSRYSDRTSSVVYSNASCTTNCLAPIMKVLNDSFGVSQALMTTVHASTQSQHVLDGYSKKDRRAGRSIMGNIIPTSTGAAAAISAVLPELEGKVTGISVRVPTTNVSMVDLTVATEKATSLTEIMDAFTEAARSDLAGVLSVEQEELVSSDFLGHSSSAVIDVKASKQLNDRFFKIIAWYDNEWAYSCRLLDMLTFMSNEEAGTVTQDVTTVPVKKMMEVVAAPITTST